MYAINHMSLDASLYGLSTRNNERQVRRVTASSFHPQMSFALGRGSLLPTHGILSQSITVGYRRVGQQGHKGHERDAASAS